MSSEKVDFSEFTKLIVETRAKLNAHGKRHSEPERNIDWAELADLIATFRRKTTNSKLPRP